MLGAMDVLWAAWRNEYITGEAPTTDGCLFCHLPGEDDAEALIVERGDSAYTVLNLYPYSPGHLVVTPYRHVANIAGLTPDEAADSWRLLARAEQALTAAMSPGGFNMGINLGQVAGAGIPEHIHIHLVPRWSGDTNFMSATARTRVLPEDLTLTREKLLEALSDRR